jgi:hypothetical protein
MYGYKRRYFVDTESFKVFSLGYVNSVYLSSFWTYSGINTEIKDRFVWSQNYCMPKKYSYMDRKKVAVGNLKSHL